MQNDKAELTRKLHAALHAENEDEVRALIQEEKADLNARDAHGNTPLMVAAKKGNVALVTLLLEGRPGLFGGFLGGKADRELENNKDETALMLAAENGHTDVVKLLCDEHSFRGRSNRRRTLLRNQGEESLALAARYGHTETLIYLLNQSLRSPNYRDVYTRGLINAIQGGHLDCVNKILYISNNTAIQIFYKSRSDQYNPIVYALLSLPKNLREAGAEKRLQIVEALIKAAALGSPEMLNTLHMQQGREKIVSLTPLQVALKAGNVKIVALLIKAGARAQSEKEHGKLIRFLQEAAENNKPGAQQAFQTLLDEANKKVNSPLGKLKLAAGNFLSKVKGEQQHSGIKAENAKPAVDSRSLRRLQKAEADLSQKADAKSSGDSDNDSSSASGSDSSSDPHSQNAQENDSDSDSQHKKRQLPAQRGVAQSPAGKQTASNDETANQNNQPPAQRRDQMKPLNPQPLVSDSDEGSDQQKDPSSYGLLARKFGEPQRQVKEKDIHSGRQQNADQSPPDQGQSKSRANAGADLVSSKADPDRKKKQGRADSVNVDAVAKPLSKANAPAKRNQSEDSLPSSNDSGEKSFSADDSDQRAVGTRKSRTSANGARTPATRRDAHFQKGNPKQNGPDPAAAVAVEEDVDAEVSSFAAKPKSQQPQAQPAAQKGKRTTTPTPTQKNKKHISADTESDNDENHSEKEVAARQPQKGKRVGGIAKQQQPLAEQKNESDVELNDDLEDEWTFIEKEDAQFNWPDAPSPDQFREQNGNSKLDQQYKLFFAHCEKEKTKLADIKPGKNGLSKYCDPTKVKDACRIYAQALDSIQQAIKNAKKSGRDTALEKALNQAKDDLFAAKEVFEAQLKESAPRVDAVPALTSSSTSASAAAPKREKSPSRSSASLLAPPRGRTKEEDEQVMKRKKIWYPENVPTADDGRTAIGGPSRAAESGEPTAAAERSAARPAVDDGQAASPQHFKPSKVKVDEGGETAAVAKKKTLLQRVKGDMGGRSVLPVGSTPTPRGQIATGSMSF